MAKRRRKERDTIRNLKKGYYHLSTDGWKDGFLFHTREQYAYGMIVIGLLTLHADIIIYSFSLMPNHVHIILSGNGGACLKAFDYLRNKLSTRLKLDGYATLPDDYWFKLTPVDEPEQMKNNFIYVDRNAYERLICIPAGYPWSSSYLHFSLIGKMIRGHRADSFSKRELERMTGSRTNIPPHWEFHATHGLLPSSFIDNSLFFRLFNNPKDYESRLVKDYEAYVKVGKALDEPPEFSKIEINDIVERLVLDLYPGRKLRQLSNDQKGRLAILLMKNYNLKSFDIASAINVSEHIVGQWLRAKDYGNQK
jgi:hypothetical protein